LWTLARERRLFPSRSRPGDRSRPISDSRLDTSDRIMSLKDVIASCLVIALGIILAIHFAMFWMYGGVFIYESNKIILIVETTMSIAIMGFGLERLLSYANASNRQRGPAEQTDPRSHHVPATRMALPAHLRPSERPPVPAAATASTTVPRNAFPLLEGNRWSLRNGDSLTATSADDEIGGAIPVVRTQPQANGRTEAV
jgi:hypothetical protein